MRHIEGKIIYRDRYANSISKDLYLFGRVICELRYYYRSHYRGVSDQLFADRWEMATNRMKTVPLASELIFPFSIPVKASGFGPRIVDIDYTDWNRYEANRVDFAMASLMQDMPLRLLKVHHETDNPSEPCSLVYEQAPKWGPRFLCYDKTPGGLRLMAAGMCEDYADEMNPTWYTPEGLWSDSQYEYLAREKYGV